MSVGYPTRSLPSKRALLFLAAIGFPCVLLVVLSLRMLSQERELAEKRLADDRRRIAADVRQELLARLERLRLDALNAATTDALDARQRQAVALIGRVEGQRLVLPWDRSENAAAFAAVLSEQRFADDIRAGERDELVTHQFDSAVVAYRRALNAARLPSQTAFAQLLAARALAKGRRAAEAQALYRTVVRVPVAVVDEQGIPFALYAARRLLESANSSGSDEAAILELLRAAQAAAPHLQPAAVYMVGDLAKDLAARSRSDTVRGPANALVDSVISIKGDIEQALALQNALPGLLAKSTTGRESDLEPTWWPFGERDRLWLVSTGSGAGAQRVVAARADPLFASLDTARRSAMAQNSVSAVQIVLGSQGESLGENFPGLSVMFSPPDASLPPGAASLQRSFYLAALVLVVSMTLVGGYLFWRDVRREVRVAEMRTQFVSSVSHELKTPLTAIRMFAETLLMGRSTSPGMREEYLETIVNETERLTRLLNNVLDFSKIEQGKKTYRLESQSLPAIVTAAARAMQYPLSQQGFELRVDLDESLPPVAVDPDAIQQAILNLLSNAMKYSGDGRLIDVRLTREGNLATISVTDRGLGIPLHEHGRIFEKFYRITGPDHERIPGTGLGLTLVAHIAEAHGGKVAVRSASGEGSTFSMLLPLARPSPAVASSREALA